MDTLELAHRERATENVDRGRFTDENFESILKAGGGSEHELDVLRLRLEEILERYIATAEKPTTEFEVSFLEFSHPPNMRKELTRVWKSCDKILAELAEVDVRYQLNSAREHGQSNAKFSVEYPGRRKARSLTLRNSHGQCLNARQPREEPPPIICWFLVTAARFERARPSPQSVIHQVREIRRPSWPDTVGGRFRGPESYGTLSYCFFYSNQMVLAPPRGFEPRFSP